MQTVWPCREMALLMMTLAVNVTLVVQVQVPDGTNTRSPFDAELMAVCTSAREQEAALMSAAWDGTESQSKKNMVANTDFLQLILFAEDVLTSPDCSIFQNDSIMALIIA